MESLTLTTACCPASGNSVKCRAHNIERLNVRSSIQEPFQSLQRFRITSGVVSLLTPSVIPEADCCDLSAIWNSQND